MSTHPSLPGATHLECTGTGEHIESERLVGVSTAGKPLFARYDLDALRAAGFTVDAMRTRRADLWRYAEVLPVRDPRAVVTLGEGWTPLLDAPRTATRLGVRRVWIKDEGQNPTGSFKARGLCLAVSRALELGAEELALPRPATRGARPRPTAPRRGFRCTSSCRATRLLPSSRRSTRSARTYGFSTG
jgi:threonine synthase